MLGFRESAELVARYALPRPIGELVATPEEAVEQTNRFGGPVALKLVSRSLPHKSRSGLVRLGVFGTEQILRSVAELQAAAPGEDDIEGILVQPMIHGGLELFLGALVDEQFGPMLAFGPGGTLVEQLGGADFLRPPVGRHHLRLFLRRNAAYPLIASENGGPSPRLDMLIELLLRLATLITERKNEIGTIDINPLVLSAGSQVPIVLDLRIEGRTERGRH